jgi:phage shock protein PspC (stress-responsive transcriptional regulator)
MSVAAREGQSVRMDDTTVRARLVRRSDHRLFAGVAGGLSDYFGIGAGWFRVGFVLASFAGGMGVVAYLLLWFIVPREDLPRSAMQQTADHFPDAPAWIGLALLGIGVLSLASSLGIHAGAVSWALLLIGVGFLLFRRSEDIAREQTDAVEPATTSPPSLPGEPTVVLRRAHRTRPVRERSPLGWLVLGLALAASGVVAVLRNAGTIHLSLTQALAIPLTILGVGLLVGTLLGRARWTVMLGIPLTLIVIAASAFTVPLNGRWADTRVTHAAQLQTSYVRSGGHLTLDLAGMDPSRLPSTIDVRMGAGNVEVLIPPHGVRVEASVNIGKVRMRHTYGGVGPTGSLGDPNASTVVTVHVDVGEVDASVQRAHLPTKGISG